MDPIFVAVAFVFGFAASRLGLPPLVGFLVAGFALNAAGAEGGEILEQLAEVGVLLLLFTIGLKLRVRDLLKPEVWAGASAHMAITVVIFGGVVFGLSAVGLSLFAGMDLTGSLLVAFALSFSSTVFAVKVLEEKSEMGSLYGRVAIGILIMQDVIAVVFLTASIGKLPSPWAVAYVIALLAARPLLMWLLDRSGHGELLAVFGLALALFLGAGGFEMVGLKPDLGALLAGLLLASHPKAAELSKTLLTMKELFLVGFFLEIGLAALPTAQTRAIGSLFTLLLPIKVVLFIVVLTRFRLRARSALLSSLALANYSEFGLITGAVGVSNGWIGSEWLVVLALALSISFVLASPLNSRAHEIYARLGRRITRLETEQRHPDDQLIDPGDAQAAILGMGRIGTGAYEALRGRYGKVLIGLDSDAAVVRRQQQDGRNVILGDATDPDFWARVGQVNIRLVLLAMNDHQANLSAARSVAARRAATDSHSYKVVAIAQHPDQIAELELEGVDAVFNFYAEAGAGFADHACQVVEESNSSTG
jgi:predicted Kef-type K+ transport protein